jgi:hypothetical protein
VTHSKHETPDEFYRYFGLAGVTEEISLAEWSALRLHINEPLELAVTPHRVIQTYWTGMCFADDESTAYRTVLYKHMDQDLDQELTGDLEAALEADRRMCAKNRTDYQPAAVTGQ